MTSTDFAAAQQRVLARRQLRTTEAQTRRELHTASASQLPFPFGGLARKGIESWDVIKGREGTRPAFRVGQVDSELLDEELLELLRAQVGEALKFFGSHLRDDWSSEILFGLRATLFKLSIWDHDASYGAALQNLRYTDARHKGSAPRAPAPWQKAIYGLVTVGGRYVWEKWETWLVEQEGGYEEPTATVRLYSRISSLASTTHSIAAFVSFLVFLVNGRYRTLLDRILRLRLAPPVSQVSRQVSFEYLNRQLVWHAFTEFLLFLLPLVGISRWRRWLSRVWRKTKSLVRRGGDHEEGETKGGELAFLPERTCAICYSDQNPTSTSENEIMVVTGASGGVVGSAQTDVTNPYETIPCGCIYCFVCIATRLEAEEGEGWVCLRCGELVKESKPWDGDVLEAISRPPSGKSVSFSDDEKQIEALGAESGDDIAHR
ncbi:peroxisome assembly protein (Peroxin-2) [Xylographa trunciseda]|nr:peroxisome assembly protein (Peroxin-2) [Xylographa trunciseda]